jgi:hypothetical protein
MARFDVSVTERKPAPAPSDRAQNHKCKCKCVGNIPGAWSRAPAEPTAAVTAPRPTELSPLSD